MYVGTQASLIIAGNLNLEKVVSFEYLNQF